MNMFRSKTENAHLAKNNSKLFVVTGAHDALCGKQNTERPHSEIHIVPIMLYDHDVM